jgi:hypothetical protein
VINVTINYDNTLDEIETASKLFWRKYALKRTMMLSVVFQIIIATSILRIADSAGESRIISWIIMGFAGGFLANLWLKPRRRRKLLLFALSTMNRETYTAAFSDSSIEIETRIQSDAEQEQTDKSQYQLDSEELCSIETDEMFLLCVNRALVHAFPKRCMSEADIENLRKYFTEKRI